MSLFYTASGQSFTLASSISSTQTSITLSSFKVPVTGTDITMASMNTSIAYGTLAPGTSSSELISFTGIVQNANGTATLTGVTRGLDKEYPYTEDSNFKQPHAGQTIFILSDAPQVFNEYPAKRNDETITGQFTFPQGGNASAARAGAVYSAPTQDTEFASKKYVDDTASFGAPLASQNTAGLIEFPTATQVEAGTILGETGAGLSLMNSQYGARKVLGYEVSGGTPNAYTVTLASAPTAYATGQIIGFTALFTNTGNATVNINGLGAKNLFLGGTGLFAGAIATNQVIGAVYNGTQFDIVQGSNLISPSASASTVGLRNSVGDMIVPTTPSSSTAAASKSYVDTKGTVKIISTTKLMSSSTTTTIAHGLGSTPSFGIFDVNRETTAGTGINGSIVVSRGAYDGVTQYSNYTAVSTTGPNSSSSRDTTHGVHYAYGANASDTDTNIAVISWDSTNVTFTWTIAGSPTGTANIVGFIFA